MQSKIRFASQGETTMADFFDDQNNMTEDDDIITLYNEVADKDEDFIIWQLSTSTTNGLSC